MNSHLTILEDAIGDIGYWRWWVADLPQMFQVEFGGVQLWTAPGTATSPPSGVVALRFASPSAVEFLLAAETDATEQPPPDWPSALAEDRIEPFGLTHGTLTLTSEARAEELRGAMAVHQTLHCDPELPSPPAIVLALRAGAVGLYVRAAEIVVVTQNGPLALEDVAPANERWWEYWRTYWARRNSPDPLPHDWACEVTIPTAAV